MATRTVELTEELSRFVDERVSTGQYPDASAVVEDSLRLLAELEEDREEELEWLREAAQEGIDDIEAGRYITLHSREEIKDLLQTIRAEVHAEIEAEAQRA